MMSFGFNLHNSSLVVDEQRPFSIISFCTFRGEAETTGNPEQEWKMGIIFVLVQIFSSCFAGVYNEYLLKKSGAAVK